MSRVIDKFLIAIVCAAVLGTLLPARGFAVPVLDWSVKSAIFVLFFLYGARLKPAEALAGLKHWRLHLTILGFTYVVFPLVGVLLQYTLTPVLSAALVLGLAYTTLVPSTVQSSVTFTSIAKGNVAGAIVSASASNLLGVLLTPALVMLVLASAGQVSIGWGAVLAIVVQLLVPFVLGQFSRVWTAGFVKRNHSWLKYFDQTSIVLVVYSAFSAGQREHMWSRVSAGQLMVVAVLCCVVLAVMLMLTWAVAGWLGFTREDRIAIQFCGTKKSLATGLPMATVLFATLPIGLVVLPLMIFHMLQLMACSALAARYGRRSVVDPE